MPAGQGPQAAILRRRILEREPQADDAERLGVEEGRVGVAGHLAADAGLLEDVHRLQQQRPADADAVDQPGQRRRAREGGEDRVEIVQRMADLVDRQRLGLAHPARIVEGLLLEEEADLVAGAGEVVIRRMAMAGGREDRRDAGEVGRVDQAVGALDQPLAAVGRDEFLEQQVAVALIGGAHRRRQVAARRRGEAGRLGRHAHRRTLPRRPRGRIWHWLSPFLSSRRKRGSMRPASGCGKMDPGFRRDDVERNR